MSILNIPVIKQGLMQKTNDQLINIISLSQDDYEISVITLIKEILSERGILDIDIEEYNNSYLQLKSRINNKPKVLLPASFIARFCQYLIDHLIFFGICLLIKACLSSSTLLTLTTYESSYGIAYILYYTLTLGIFNATIGMGIFGLKLVDNDKNKTNFQHGLMRAIFMVLNFFTFQLGHLWMFIDKKERTAVDIWSQTRVVYK